MKFIQELYHSDFHTKLALAHELFRKGGDALSALPLVRKGLASLDQHAQLLEQKMGLLNCAPLCARCALKKGGGCCSLYMADENDAVLFLINLLAGHHVSVQKDDDFECYLLGPKGCTLRFKPMFCLNYNCEAIKKNIDAEALSSYLAASAQLLQVQWQVERLVLAHLQSEKNFQKQ